MRMAREACRGRGTEARMLRRRSGLAGRGTSIGTNCGGDRFARRPETRRCPSGARQALQSTLRVPMQSEYPSKMSELTVSCRASSHTLRYPISIRIFGILRHTLLCEILIELCKITRIVVPAADFCKKLANWRACIAIGRAPVYCSALLEGRGRGLQARSQKIFACRG